MMPVYNGERFLDRAITSISDQTFRDFEFVIVDDGSTDSTPAILADAARRDARITVSTHRPNRGVVAARNTAFAHARGALLAVMDSDDVALPDRLARQVAFMDAHPDISVLGGAVQLIDENDVPGPIKTYPTQPGLVAWSMLFLNSIAHSTLMLRCACAEGGYPAGGAEDYGLLAPLSLHVRMANLSEVLVKYRSSPQALTARAWERQEAHANEIVQNLIGELSGQAVSLDQVRILRGLSRDQYPSDPDSIARTAELIVTLASARTAAPNLPPADVRAIRRDAGTRLLLLAALAARRSPGLAASLAVRGVRLSPGSMGSFTAKAARRVVNRLVVSGTRP